MSLTLEDLDLDGDSGWLLPGAAAEEPDDAVTVAEADAFGGELATTSAQVLAGLIAASLVEYAGGPAGLLGVLFPDAQGEERDRLMFHAGAIAGAGVATRRMRRRAGYAPGELADMQKALYDAGFEVMGNAVGHAARAFRDDAPAVEPAAPSE